MNKMGKKDIKDTVTKPCVEKEKPEILEEIVIEKIGIDGICGVY